MASSAFTPVLNDCGYLSCFAPSWPPLHPLPTVSSVLYSLSFAITYEKVLFAFLDELDVPWPLQMGATRLFDRIETCSSARSVAETLGAGSRQIYPGGGSWRGFLAQCEVATPSICEKNVSITVSKRHWYH